MKYIIIGLGNFGSSLAQKLTALNNEVIGVDIRMDRIEAIKDKITHAINLDSTESAAVSNLPLRDTDVVVVAIGENQGANVMTTALMKKLNVKRLISRAQQGLQEMVLEAMGVDEIIHPEEETAERWAKKLNMRGVVDSFELNEDYSIVEVQVPDEYDNRTLQEIRFREDYDLIILTTMKVTEGKNDLGCAKKITNIKGVASADTKLYKGDIMVIYGNKKDIRKLLEDQQKNDR
ncbi:potassium channel family protein [Zunongwangia atlantica]|uniref:TrkA-N domain-containing protein n=1 Tax=Zunongwangia atlantica 22II14-10F7 TaxID=1185767 RepID=A0A1Y1T5I3_9FLAO|nr:TrkA family potassium uptake protein [Zunongwangia atlantica]ORL46300.1 TrkA-N domain-containing protein [Zunongwangia atlantica 22II14-10F7]